MKQVFAHIWLVFAAFALASCGPSLGTYEVAELEVVDELPVAITHSEVAGLFLRIDLASNFDLVSEGNGNIYPFMSRCSYFDDEERMVHGPLAAGDPPIDLYDVGEAMARDTTGRAHYVIYVPVAAPESRKISNQPELNFAYDLAADGEDLCLRIEQRGYFITPSHSRTIRIPYFTLSRVLSEPMPKLPENR